MAEHDPIGRRQFLVIGSGAAAGLILGFRFRANASEAGEPGALSDAAFAPNAYLQIVPSGRVTVTIPRPDMGQGIRTALPMLVAEELDAPWSAIEIVQAGADRRFDGEQYSGGSNSVRNSWEPMRAAGATARAMLVSAAAARWSVEPSSCRTEEGAVIHTATGRRLSYGALCADAARQPVPAKAPLKEPHEFRLIGRRTRNLDVPAIVTGRPLYGIDVRVPGMLFASIERSPTIGAQVDRVDDAAARAMPGVRHVVTIDAAALPALDESSSRPANGVAVIASSTWQAMQARKALRISWTPGHGSGESTAARQRDARERITQPPQTVRNTVGDPVGALASAARRVEATYETPMVAHATMEPMNATAHVRSGRCEVWAPTQNPEGIREALVAALGVPADSIVVHVTRSGGGFGRRFYADFAVEAALLSRAASAPVQVIWTREDDMKHGFPRPGGLHLLRAGLDGGNALAAWTHTIVNSSRDEFLSGVRPAGSREFPGGTDLEPVEFPCGLVPNFQVSGTAQHSPVPVGQWRAIEDSTSVFAYQSFVDELAHAAGTDPVAFRLEMLGEPRELPWYDKVTYDSGRLIGVIKLAAEKSGWGTPLPTGWGRGIAASFANKAFVAEVAEVEVDAAGGIRVHRVVCAVDCGIIVNPSGAEAQVQGGVLFALSAALKQEITVENGAVVQGNFNDFPVLRISEAPRVEVHFVPSTLPPRGLGEPGVPPLAPAVANAVFAATGKRLRRMPFRMEEAT